MTLFWQVVVEDYNDHCPFLQEVNINLNLEPIPPLRKAAFFTAVATDKDSGVNGRITYNVSDPERMYVWYRLNTSVHSIIVIFNYELELSAG